MDVNGAQFYQVRGERGWADSVPALADPVPPDVAFDDGDLRLRPETPIFPRSRRDVPLTAEARRGAARDENGWWYWIDASRTRILRARAGAASRVWWEQTAAPVTPSEGEFHDAAASVPAPIELGGLAINDRGYLIAGDLSRGGVLVFDLTATASPLRITWRGCDQIRAFDMAAVGGAVWILDREHRACWRLDRYLRVVSCVPGSPPEPVASPPGSFAPEGESAEPAPATDVPRPILLSGQSPIAIEAFTGDSVLVLGAPESPAEGDASIIYLVKADGSQAVLRELRDVFEHAEGPDPLRPVLGHDLAYDAKSDRIVVVERDGNQAIALARMPGSAGGPDRWVLTPEFLPMHRHPGRALVYAGDACWYDLTPSGADTSAEPARWVMLGSIPQPRYARQAGLVVLGPEIDAGQRAFDGQRPACVWHRLFVDACIPADTSLTVWARATDDLDILEGWSDSSGATGGWIRQPSPYRRGLGAEIPLHRPFGAEPADEEGTWELLFQGVQGRYLQIRLELGGNGRRTPRLRALRLYFPRTSYTERYLPAIYHGGVRTAECQELHTPAIDDADPPIDNPAASDRFLERLLANMEGIYTDLEGRVRTADAVVDPRSAPTEALDWLAAWVGITLDPIWGSLGKGRESQSADRRRLVIRMARKLYERRGTPVGLRLALLLLLDPCLEELMRRLEKACVREDAGLLRRLARLGLAAPSAATTDEQLEDLFHDLLVDLGHPSSVRLVERFLTRGGRSVTAGDSSGAASAGGETDTAHRFSVLIPVGLGPDERDMVRRLVELERPAHTAFEIKEYGEGFRVGLSRVGYETALGPVPAFRPLIVGRNAPRDGYLSAEPLMGSVQRWIAGRDGPGRSL